MAHVPHKSVARDNFPRAIDFTCISWPNHGNTAARPCTISLPYQVKPDGNILCTEILSADILWTPVALNYADIHLTQPTVIHRRLIFDASTGRKQNISQTPAQAQQGPWAYDPVLHADLVQNPYSYDGVVKVVDRVKTYHVNAGIPATLMIAEPEVSLSETVDFGCHGSYPIVASPNMNIYSLVTASQFNGAVTEPGTLDYVPTVDAVGAPPLNPNTDQVFHRAGRSDGGTNRRYPAIHGRIMYRLVEITPWQHLLISERYNNHDNTYNFPSEEVASGAGLYAQYATNPYATGGTAVPTIWPGI